VKELFYDAEHFFDGYRADPNYALETVRKAVEARVDCVVLCDTNGGSLPKDVEKIFAEVVKRFPKTDFGIHAHNDTDCAVANSLMAVEAGAVQVQGTINGIGERCGNANLCSLIPNLYLKLGHPCLPEGNLSKLRAISQFVFEQANLQLNRWQPYVGRSAFAHKGGVHASAVLRNPATYEHIDPVLVGNKRRMPISDQSGKVSLANKANELGISLEAKDPIVIQALQELKELENCGFQFELAEASFELLLNKIMKKKVDYFELISRHISDRKSGEKSLPEVEATLWIRVGKKTEHVVAFGDGPVHALDCALRKALEPHFPVLKKMKLTDYKVRVLPGTKGTAARVRVLVESANGNGERWHTMGVSHDIIEASWQALTDSMNYKLHKTKRTASVAKKFIKG
jgi:2-isopropylmalate synthase